MEYENEIDVNRFVWECFNGPIPEAMVIDHINDDKSDNRLCNLQLLTIRENSLKGAKNNVRRSPPRPLVISPV